MRLQEWVAEEKGYFNDEGLNYEFRDVRPDAKSIKTTEDLPAEILRGAYQTFEGQGRACDISSACHWTVNVAASNGHGRLWGEAYSVTPGGIYVSPSSTIQNPTELSGVPITVGFQSGSHYSTIQGLEPFLARENIRLHFGGLLFQRLELFLDGKVPAANLIGGPLYFVEQLGYRKILDTSFMIAAMIPDHVNVEEVRKFYRALKRAQSDIDLHPERYTHYYRNEFPPQFLKKMDTRTFGPGERIVFEKYTHEMFEQTQQWIKDWEIFDPLKIKASSYETAVVSSST